MRWYDPTQIWKTAAVIAGIGAIAGLIKKMLEKSADIESAIGWPYRLTGGAPSTPWSDGPKGVDCSGFAQMALVLMEVMPASATDRTAQGLADNSYFIEDSELKRGDLTFYGDSWDEVSHVGVYDGAGNIIEASSGSGEIVIVPIETYHSSWRHDYLGAHRWE